jgi:hypothetical protein
VYLLREAYPEGLNLAKYKGTSQKQHGLDSGQGQFPDQRTSVAQTCGFLPLAGLYLNL